VAELTEPQRRTVEQLIGTHERPVVAADLVRRLRDRIERALADLELREAVWLTKERLRAHGRCGGLFQAQLAGEHARFAHTPTTAAGVLAHRAVEVDMTARSPLDPFEVASIAARRLVDREDPFAVHWAALGERGQEEALAEAARRLTLFRASFPPLRELRSALAPIPELRLRAEFLDARLVLSGQIDLVLGLPDADAPLRATRLALDLKTGAARPEHAADLRVYALLLALRFGVPPYRVATFYLEAGTWQAEDVDERVLQHAAERLVAAARDAAHLAAGGTPVLAPGPWCAWCPRVEVCPAADPEAVPGPVLGRAP
jgi:hypothetical protein